MSTASTWRWTSSTGCRGSARGRRSSDRSWPTSACATGHTPPSSGTTRPMCGTGRGRLRQGPDADRNNRPAGCCRRMPRFTTTTLIALVLMLAAPVAAQASNPVLGVADQKASAYKSSRFKSLHVKRTRYVVPWNVALVKSQRAKFDAWLSAAHAAHVREVLVAFNASAGSRCPAKPCSLPSVRAYTKAFRAFHKHYKTIRTLQPWNEANSPTQPTGPWKRGARAAALYYNVVRHYCHRCTITAADVLDLSKRTMARWVHQFRRYAKGHPALWGLHNYTDTNKKSGLTGAFLRMVPGKVWLTETGGIVAFREASGKVRFKFSEKRAASALKRMFSIARKYRSRTTRLYVYQWSIDFSGNRFDAGLVRANGAPRPGYYVVRKYRRWIRKDRLDERT